MTTCHAYPSSLHNNVFLAHGNVNPPTRDSACLPACAGQRNAAGTGPRAACSSASARLAARSLMLCNFFLSQEEHPDK